MENRISDVYIERLLNTTIASRNRLDNTRANALYVGGFMYILYVDVFLYVYMYI